MKIFRIVLLLTSILILSGMVYLLFNCKWKWPDIRFEKVNAESITSVEILKPVSKSNLNLSENELKVTSPTAIKKIVSLMRLNEKSLVNHPTFHWVSLLQLSFADRSTLKLDIEKTRNQGCLVTFCSDCFGIKNSVRNDSLCSFIEQLVNVFEKDQLGQ